MSTAKEDSLTNSSSEELADAEADRLFAEAAEAREGKPAEMPAEADVDTAAPKPDDVPPEALTTGEGSGDEPQGQSGGSEDAAAAAAASGEGDIWADADPKLKAAFDEIAAENERSKQQFKSREGREAALQRELAKARQGKGEEPQRKPLKELLASDELKTVAEEYPDFKALIDTLSTVAERVDGVEQKVGQVEQVAVSAGTAAEEKALNQAVPNWLELVRDERFLGWVEDQPRKDRDAVAANWDAITDATAAADVFKRFEGHIAPKTPAEPESGAAPGKRERQQSGARAAVVTAPTSAGGESDDLDVQWAQAAAKADRQRGVKV